MSNAIRTASAQQTLHQRFSISTIGDLSRVCSISAGILLEAIEEFRASAPLAHQSLL